MAASQGDVAEEVTHTLSDTVSRFVFDQGVLHLQALQASAHALDARSTQVCTLQFAAAAFGASVIGPQLSWSSILAAIAVGMFVWGGVQAFRGVRSDDFRLPGVAPAWWAPALELAEFSENDARAWAAKCVQQGIENVETENCARAECLNASLRCALIGAVAVGLAAATKLAPAISVALQVAE